MNKNILIFLLLSVSGVPLYAHKTPRFELAQKIDGIDWFYRLKEYLKKYDRTPVSHEEKMAEYERLLEEAVAFDVVYADTHSVRTDLDWEFLCVGTASFILGSQRLYYACCDFRSCEAAGNKLEDVIQEAGKGLFFTALGFLVMRRSYNNSLLKCRQREIAMIISYLSSRLKELDPQRSSSRIPEILKKKDVLIALSNNTSPPRDS